MLLLEEGKQIAAVKAYREATGADLLTAKNAVDELARRR
jgi:ribosomal protein L7/L12